MTFTLLIRGRVSNNEVEEVRYKLYNELKVIENTLASNYDLIRIHEENPYDEINIYCDFAKKGGN